MSNLSYDQNGNILTMNQMGLKLNSSSPVDQLTYGYYPNTNKLAKVSDGVTGASKLGDFVDGTNQWDDYGYDVNGNLVTDLNKGMGTATGVDLTSGGGISYNHLNLPEVITTPKGTITYSYDAAGNKLKKVVAESGQPAKTTLYLGGAVYEDDQLQFIAHEEGRIRTRTPNRLDTLYYDYFIKDHLGNVRMVLTDEQKQDRYPAATMESASASTEEALYSNLTNTRVDKPNGYPYDPYLDPNYKVAKVRGDGQKVGPGILLKVMAGDKFNLRASSWYKLNGTTPSVPNTVLQDLVFMLNWGAARVPGSKETQQTLESSGVFQPGAGRFLTEHTDSYIPSRPKAFVNWVLFDEQFRYVGSCSGAEQVGDDGVLTQHVRNDLPVEKNGYLYVYVSNETPNIDVFFDNVQVTHTRGALLEETHYYPFGLTMAGISSKAAPTSDCGCPNKKGFNGNELQNKEFSDGSGLELYDFNARTYDQQTGRFIQIDPTPEDGEQGSLTPYHFSGNNPSTFNDPNGKCPWCIGAIVGAAVEYGTQVATNLVQGKSLSESLTNVDGGAILISAVAGAASGGLSALTPKSTLAKAAVKGTELLVSAGESAAKQYNETGSVSVAKTLTDVGTNIVGEAVTKNVKVNSSSTIKTTEKQLDRAQRVAANDATSSGRAATVKKLESKVSSQKAANQGAQQAASGAVSNTMQAGVDAAANSKPAKAPTPAYSVNQPAVDNTAVKRPIFY